MSEKGKDIQIEAAPTDSRAGIPAQFPEMFKRLLVHAEERAYLEDNEMPIFYIAAPEGTLFPFITFSQLSTDLLGSKAYRSGRVAIVEAETVVWGTDFEKVCRFAERMCAVLTGAQDWTKNIFDEYGKWMCEVDDISDIFDREGDPVLGRRIVYRLTINY
jgi:hypothetical protein